LIRSALPKVDEKAASKWAAALDMAEQDTIAPKHFLAFLRGIGGIEGAHRRRAVSGESTPGANQEHMTAPQKLLAAVNLVRHSSGDNAAAAAA